MHPAPAPLHRAVEEWFASHGLIVHETHYQFDHGFYAWRHYGDKQILTLWISELTIEDYPPSTIPNMLKDFEPRSLMDEYRHAHLHVASNDSEFGAYARPNFSPRAAE
jgi:hypothetical protein